ncbi:MAG: TIGR02186 family protein [Caldimicrobium sp.]
MRERKFILSIMILILLLFNIQKLKADSFEVKPEKILINFTYHGANLKITGQGNCAGKDFVINILSTHKEKATFKKIEKVANLIWMKTGDLHFENVPFFYHVYSTRPIEEILTKKDLEEYSLTFDSLKKGVNLFPVKDENQKNFLWQEFIKYKSKYHLYAYEVVPYNCKGEGQNQLLEISIHWPYQAPPGVYQIKIYEISNRKIENIAEKIVEVEKVGLVKFLTDFAQNHALIYGVFSVLIALVSGFLVGLIFKKGGH